jgi:hypothetical protein
MHGRSNFGYSEQGQFVDSNKTRRWRLNLFFEAAKAAVT